MKKIIEEFVKGLSEKTKADLEHAVKSAENELEDYLKHLDSASKIILPANILDILAKGGDIDVFKIGKNSRHLEVRVGNIYSHTDLKPDKKYRITVIAEVVE